LDKKEIITYSAAVILTAARLLKPTEAYADTISGYNQFHEIRSSPIESQLIDEKSYNNVVLKEYSKNNRLSEERLSEDGPLSFSDLENLVEDIEGDDVNSWTVSILNFYDATGNNYQFVVANPETSQRRSENTQAEITDLLRGRGTQPSGWRFDIDSRANGNDDAEIYDSVREYLDSNERFKELRLENVSSRELDSILRDYASQPGWGVFPLSSEARNGEKRAIIAAIPDNYNLVINYGIGGEHSFIIGAQPRGSAVVVPAYAGSGDDNPIEPTEPEDPGFENNDDPDLDNPSNPDNTADTPVEIGDNPRDGIENQPPWANPDL
jgi:hypothetical protein